MLTRMQFTAWLILGIACVVMGLFLIKARHKEAGITLFGVGTILVLSNLFIFHCRHCGTRPGLWPSWLITLFSYDFLFSEHFMHRKCPKCKKELFENSAGGTKSS